MSLNIKNAEVEALVDEVAQLEGVGKTEVVRRALLERRTQLKAAQRREPMSARLRRYLETEVWPTLPAPTPWSREQEDSLLGYGEHGA